MDFREQDKIGHGHDDINSTFASMGHMVANGGGMDPMNNGMGFFYQNPNPHSYLSFGGNTGDYTMNQPSSVNMLHTNQMGKENRQHSTSY